MRSWHKFMGGLLVAGALILVGSTYQTTIPPDNTISTAKLQTGILNADGRHFKTQWGDSIPVLNNLVLSRNAALMPKTYDSRLEILASRTTAGAGAHYGLRIVSDSTTGGWGSTCLMRLEYPHNTGTSASGNHSAFQIAGGNYNPGSWIGMEISHALKTVDTVTGLKITLPHENDATSAGLWVNMPAATTSYGAYLDGGTYEWSSNCYLATMACDFTHTAGLATFTGDSLACDVPINMSGQLNLSGAVKLGGVLTYAYCGCDSITSKGDTALIACVGVGTDSTDTCILIDELYADTGKPDGDIMVMKIWPNKSFKVKSTADEDTPHWFSWEVKRY